MKKVPFCSQVCFSSVETVEGTFLTVKSRSLAAFFLGLEMFIQMAALQHTTYGITPRFPVEIEEIIFVLTVRAYPSSWVTLVRVAKRVQTWFVHSSYMRTPHNSSFSGLNRIGTQC